MTLQYNLSTHAFFSNKFEIKDTPLVITWPHSRVIPAFMHGHTGIYRTAESAFLATRAMGFCSAEMFEVGGLFDDVKLLQHWPVGATEFGNFSSEKGVEFEKHFVMGVIANMAGNVAPDRAKLLWGLNLCSEGPPEQTTRIWIYILKYKFLL